MRLPFHRLLIVPAVALAAAAAAQEGYQTPPDAIVRIAEAPPTPGISVSPDKTHAVLTHRSSLAPLAELSRPELRIAGLRIDPAANAASRRRMFRDVTLERLDGGEAVAITGLPDPLRGDHLSWSPDGTRFAFTHTGDDGVELWVVEAASGTATRLVAGVNAIFRGSPFRWLGDSAHLAVKIVDPGRGAMPEVPAVPETPVIQETTGRVAPVRTYQDLLQSPHDNAVFAYLGAARAVVADLSGNTTEIAGPGIIEGFAPSPDGSYLLVTTIHEPFSWLVPYSRFPHRIEVRDRSGAAVHEVADLPLHEEIPIGRDSAPTGPRSVNWRGDHDATLVWTEARDGGDPHAEASVRDVLVQLAAPFEGDPEVLLQVPLRMMGATFGGGRGVAITRWWINRAEQIWSIPTAGSGEPALAFDTSYEDRYAAPGTPLTTRNERGARVLLTSADGSKAYLTAEGASPQGNRPFVDEWDLETGETRRLFQSDADSYETPLALLDPEAGLLLTRKETRTTPPNYYVRDLGGGGEARAITDFAHPYPALQGAGRELIRYHRNDGVELNALLHTPPGYDAARDGRLPLIVWAYPREYKSAAAAAQVRDSPQRFSFVSWGSALYWLTQGYAVMEKRHHSDHRRGGPGAERQLRRAARRERAGGSGRGGPARGGRPRADGDRRAFLRRVHDREPAGALGHLPGGDRPERRLQPHPDPLRFPERAADLLGGAGDLLPDVPVHARAPGQRADPAGPRHRGQQLRHFPDPEPPLLPRAEGARGDRPPRDAAPREPRLRRPRVGDAHPLGAAPVAGTAREERRATDGDDPGGQPPIGKGNAGLQTWSSDRHRCASAAKPPPLCVTRPSARSGLENSVRIDGEKVFHEPATSESHRFRPVAALRGPRGRSQTRTGARGGDQWALRALLGTRGRKEGRRRPLDPHRMPALRVVG